MVRRMRSVSRRITVADADVVPPIATLRISAAWGLAGLLNDLGVDQDVVLADAGLSADLFSNRENLITYPQLERLLLAGEQRSGCDYFGMLLGQRARLADMGLAGQVALCQPTGGAGLRNFIDHFNLHDTAATVALIESGSFAQFAYAISEHGLSDTRQFQLAGVTIACNILQDLFGPDWLPVEVRFASRSPSNLRPFQKYFAAPLRFDADESAVLFERRWLERPLPKVDSQLRDDVERAVRKQRAEMLADFPATVRRVLRKQVLLGDISMSVGASRLSMHRRTLDRHLQAHHTTYQELLESVREGVARLLLHDTDMPIQQIAESVRFASAASFATAFRRRTGMSPSEYRRRAR
jgi:AraC-like DNA-binding protein